MAEKSRDGPGEKAARGFKKELRGFCSHQEVGSLRSWRCGGRGTSRIGCSKTKNNLERQE